MSDKEIEKLPTSVFNFTDNSEELIARGIGWDHPDFLALYKTNLSLSQPLELPLSESDRNLYLVCPGQQTQ